MKDLSKEQQKVITSLINAIDGDNDTTLDDLLSTVNEAFVAQLNIIIMEDTQSVDRSNSIQMAQLRMHALIPALKGFYRAFKA